MREYEARFMASVKERHGSVVQRPLNTASQYRDTSS